MHDEAASAIDGGETTDRLLGGRLVLRQPNPGYRAGMDAALLAAACEAGPGEQVLEAGCGVGAALMAAALRSPGTRWLGIERDPTALALAEANIAANDLSARVQVRAWEVGRGFRALGLGRFDAAMANPPFFDDPASLRPPHPSRAGAYLADEGLAAWTGFLLAAVRDGGRITAIHRADRLGDLLALLGEKAGSFRIRPVAPFADRPAKRVLVRAVRGGKAPLVLLPPLVMHDRDAGPKHTAAAEAILRGEAPLAWD
jgi:tRNA1(Val) A37 N6-methylase TrmN6